MIKIIITQYRNIYSSNCSLIHLFNNSYCLIHLLSYSYKNYLIHSLHSFSHSVSQPDSLYIPKHALIGSLSICFCIHHSFIFIHIFIFLCAHAWIHTFLFIFRVNLVRPITCWGGADVITVWFIPAFIIYLYFCIHSCIHSFRVNGVRPVTCWCEAGAKSPRPPPLYTTPTR